MWHVWASFSLNLFKTCQADAEGFIQVSITDVIRWHLKQEPTATICQLFKAIWSPNHLLLNRFFSSAVFQCNFILLIMICFCCVFFMGIFSLDVDLDPFPTADQTLSSYSRWWGKDPCFSCVLFCGFHAVCIQLKESSAIYWKNPCNALNFWVARVPEITSFKKSLVWLCTWLQFPIYKALTMSMWFLHNGLRCRASTWHQRGAAMWE